MKKAKWSTGFFSKADAQLVGEEIKSISESPKAQDIVNYAKKHKKSELYKCFTWDDTEAAEKWRLHEARNIICNLIIEEVEEDVPEEKLTYRMFYKTSKEPDTGYEETEKIVVNKEKSLGMLEVAKSELEAFRNKYSTLTKLVPEIVPVMDSIDSFLGKDK